MAAKKPSSLKQQIKEIVEATRQEAVEFGIKLGFKAGAGLQRAVIDEISWWDSKGYNPIDPNYELGGAPPLLSRVSANAPAWPRVRSLAALEVVLDPLARANVSVGDLDDWIEMVDDNMTTLRRWAPKAGPRPPADVMTAWSKYERTREQIRKLGEERDRIKRSLPCRTAAA